MAKAVTTVRRLLPVLVALHPQPREASIVAVTGKIEIADAIEGMRVRLSMERASTLTVRVADPDGELWRNKMLQEDLRLTFPQPRYVDEWRLWKSRGIGTIGREADVIVLTFWDAGSAALKRVVKPLTRSAATLNWEGWVTLNAAQAAGDYRLKAVVPRPNSTPPREDGEDAATTAGWSAETRAKVTIKGQPASAEQLKEIDEALKAAVAAKAPPRAVLALVCAGIGESNFTAIMNTAGSPYGGVFQGKVKERGGPWDIGDTAGMATSFLQGGKGFQAGGAIALARENRSMSPGTIATKVEASGKPGSFYDAHATEARTIIELWSGVELAQWAKVTGPAGTDDGYGDTGNARPTEWRRGRPGENESALKALSRNAEGLGQRAFVAASRLVAARDQDLILAAPHLSIDFLDDNILAELPSVEPGANTLSLRVEAAQWGAPPGAVVEIKNAGPLPRTWLVQTVESDAAADTADVVLQQPTTKIPKPPTTRDQAGEQLTGTQQEVAIKWAINQIGIKERPPGSNNGPEVGKIITDNGGTVGQPWCGYFCRGALRAAGLTPSVSMASVQWIYDTSGAGGDVFKGRTTAAKAKPGDLAIIGGTGQHVGLVERVAGGKVHTIEGNTSDQCARRSHAYSAITAIAQVKWSSSTPGTSSPPNRTSVEQNAVNRAG